MQDENGEGFFPQNKYHPIVKPFILSGIQKISVDRYGEKK
jgi:hypothetical protein